jgi:hypothetical protein
VLLSSAFDLAQAYYTAVGLVSSTLRYSRQMFWKLRSFGQQFDDFGDLRLVFSSNLLLF